LQERVGGKRSGKAFFAATVVLIGLAEQPFAGTEADAAPLRAAMASAPP
jgi:hypothetical protein